MLKKILKSIPYLIYSFFVTRLRLVTVDNIQTLSERKKMIYNVMSYIANNKIEGDYLEFGVYTGSTFVNAYQTAEKLTLKSMKFFAFDSFEGLPEIKGADLTEDNQFSKGQCFCNIATFKKNIQRQGIDFNRVEIIKGWYDNTLNNQTKQKLSLKKAAIIYIDCDLYESTVPVLNFITDYVQDGTIVIFDDWFYYRGNSNKGEQKAFGEWLDKNKSIKAIEYKRFDWLGISFILNKH